MPIMILLPALSPTMEHGNLTKWLKKEGDHVCSGDLIAEVETDKATMEIECFDDGIIGKILVDAGTNKVPVNTPIAVILLENEDKSSISINNFTNEDSDNVISKDSKKEEQILDVYNSIKNKENCSEERIKSSPLAKKIAKDLNVDLSKVTGTGPSGRIIKNDVINSSKTNVEIVEKCNENNNEDKRIEVSAMRSTIAERLVYSKQNIPHYYLVTDCNIDLLLNIRKEINDELSEKVTINDFIIKAAALSIKKCPEVNCAWDNTHILQYGNIDVAVAVALKKGLVTPILKNVDKKSILQISKEVKIMSEKAKSGILRKDEYQGGSITISNLGMYDIKEFIAIINPPQSSILAIGKAEKRVIVFNNEIKIATMMTVTLSADHRLIDGALGAEFIKSFKNYIEKPMLMLI